MAHFAELDENNKVLRVIVVHNNELIGADGNEDEQEGVSFCRSLFGANTRWIQTSYNGTFRKNYAGGVGYSYDQHNDAFIPPQPYPSWVLDEAFCWKTPTPHPNDGLLYLWDEEQLSWSRVMSHWDPSSPGAISKIMAVANLTSEDTFMDIGCGDGRVLWAASQYTDRLIGIDVDAKLLAEAAEIVPQAQLLLQDAASYNFDAPLTLYSYLDYATFCYVLLRVKASGQPIKILHQATPEAPSFPVQPDESHEVSGSWIYVWNTAA